MALELDRVVKEYPGGVAALRGVSLEVPDGDQVAVVGPSGSGKTTMRTIMGTLERSTRGSVRVAGQDVGSASDRELAGLRAHEIGFVFQGFHLQEAMSVVDNVALGMLYTGQPLRQRRDVVRSALDRVGLSHRLEFKPKQLSGGERQRVAIARAIAKRPAIILPDEPTGNLDSKSGGEVMDLLHRLAADGATLSTAVPMIGHMLNVDRDAAVYQVSGVSVYRTQYVPVAETGGIGVDAAGDDLPQVVGTSMSSGHFLDARSGGFPEAVLGAQAAEVLDITRVGGHLMVYLGNTWFDVIGVLEPVLLDPSLDSTVFISLPVAERVFRTEPNPSEIYLRANVSQVSQVSNLLAPTGDRQQPDGVQVSRPSDALEARAAAQGQFTTLLLGLGAVALLVGAIGIANIMVISVLERRGEIGLRRALGATRRHISLQFLAESALLAVLGGIAGLALGAGATEVFAITRHEPFVVPPYALLAAPAAGLVIGTLAGLYPAAKAARLSPTEALRST